MLFLVQHSLVVFGTSQQPVAQMSIHVAYH